MSVSGICLDDEAMSQYECMKMGHAHELLVYEIVGKKKICYVKEKSQETCSNDGLHDFLTHKDHSERCYYLVYDLKCGKSKELIVIAWIPDSGPVGDKMIYATSMEAIKKKFEGVKHYIVANDLDDVNRELSSKYNLSLKS